MQQSTILKCQTKYILEQISCLATSYFKVLSFSAYIKHAPVHNTGLVMVRERDGERGTSREGEMQVSYLCSKDVIFFFFT